MQDDITNKVLLELMQSIKISLDSDIKVIKGDIIGIKEDITGIKEDIKGVKIDMKTGFEEAALHRKALQEDMEATIGMQAVHQKKLAKISVPAGRSP